VGAAPVAGGAAATAVAVGASGVVAATVIAAATGRGGASHASIARKTKNVKRKGSVAFLYVLRFSFLN
jgi:hypothetical protein